MSDPSRYSHTPGTERESSTGLSRWVKVVGVVLAVVILLGAVMLLVVLGPGGHQIPEHAPPSGVSGVLRITGYLG